jgi:hypothetical protein
MTVSIEMAGVLMTMALVFGFLIGRGHGPTMFRAVCLPFKLLRR